MIHLCHANPVESNFGAAALPPDAAMQEAARPHPRAGFPPSS